MNIAASQKVGLAASHGPHHAAERGDRVVALEQQLAEISNRLAILEAGLYGVIAPLIAAFKLTPSEAQILGHLLKRGITSKEALQMVLYGLSDAPSPKSLDVVLHKLRKKLRAFGIHVTTEGWGAVSLQATMKKRVTQMVADGHR